MYYFPQYVRFVGSATIEEEMLFCKSENSDAVGTHCVVHREALASKTLPAAMKKKLAIIIRIVNFIKSSAVNSQLFSSKVEVESHLQILKEEYDCYFSDLGNVELTEWKMTRNPFRIKEDILSEELQEEFLEMKCNSTAKDDFEAMPLNNFWAKYLHIYKNVGSVAIRTLLSFSSTYLCESGFSALVSMKTKFRNKLEREADLRCALSSTKPRIK